jgi:hypothetical protein
MTFGKFILGIIIAAIGFLIVWKAEWLLINFGRIGFAERHLGTEGGSRLFYKLIGTLIIIVGLMYATDLTDNTIRWFVKAVFKQNIPES